jgi:FkbM family methyltransferase
LYRHVRLNGCTNVEVEALALGSERGDGELFVADGREDWCNSLRPPAIDAAARRVHVSVTTVDEFLSSRGIRNVDFIKLDVEGGELDVLKGSEKLLEQPPRPVLLVEVQDIRTKPWGYVAREIIEHLMRRGFRWFAIRESGSLEPLDVSASVLEGNFVACPEERQTILGACFGGN